jgi:hypothetical protein
MGTGRGKKGFSSSLKGGGREKILNRGGARLSKGDVI